MDILAELRKWNVEPVLDGARLLISCPLPDHKDENPSCQVCITETEKVKEGSYFCPVCRKGGDFFDLLSKITKTPAAAHKNRLKGSSKKVNPKKVEGYAGNLTTTTMRTSGSQNALRQLEARGISDATIRKYSLGYDTEEDRITIPIRWGDNFVNVLKYSPGALVNKFRNYAKGYGKLPVLYPQDQLHYDKIVFCGGPLKALAVAQRMNEKGIGAISTCFGETKIPLDLIPWLAEKKVWVCYDVDSHGQIFADITCGMLVNTVNWIGNIVLPLNEYLYPKGDINDYFGVEEATIEDFEKLLEEALQWEDKAYAPEYCEEVKDVHISKLCGFSRAFNFSTSAYLAGVDDSVAHKIPKEITVSCTSDADVCSVCKLRRTANYDPLEGLTRPTEVRNPITLGFVNIPHRMRPMVFKEYFGIPEQCMKCSFVTSEELYTVRYVLLSDTQADSEFPISAAIITDGGELYSGEVCSLEGRVDQSPLTSEEVRIVTKHEPKDILSQYVVKDVALLEQFRPKDNTLMELQMKMDDINLDMERNVTFIYDRPRVHTLFDLAFHSPLWIPFENATEPGWISALLVSETAQGKSTIMRRLVSHYGHGATIDAANTSVAGLVGGIKSVGKRQFVKWGILPQMDKRLVCIEEYANAPVELLRSMRAARDSGVVMLNKIDKGRANARTRTIVLSNPKKLLKPNVVIDGVSLLEDLVERPEDLRRFDIGMWMPKLDTEERHLAHDPKYSSEACHELVTWAWTLPVDKIKYTDSASKAIRENRIKAKYPFLYLVGMREFDVKLARLSAAAACRTYNVVGGNLIVEERHVEWICRLLISLYDDPEFGYTGRVRRESDMDSSTTVDQLIALTKASGNPICLCDFLSKYNRYTTDDFKAAVGDTFAFEQIKNKLLILGCIVGEEDSRWNNVYLPTKRLKKHLAEVQKYLKRQYAVPNHLKSKGMSSI